MHCHHPYVTDLAHLRVNGSPPISGVTSRGVALVFTGSLQAHNTTRPLVRGSNIFPRTFTRPSRRVSSMSSALMSAGTCRTTNAWLESTPSPLHQFRKCLFLLFLLCLVFWIIIFSSNYSTHCNSKVCRKTSVKLLLLSHPRHHIM